MVTSAMTCSFQAMAVGEPAPKLVTRAKQKGRWVEIPRDQFSGNLNIDIMRKTQTGTEFFDKANIDPCLNTHSTAKMFQHTSVPRGGAIQGGGGHPLRGEGGVERGMGVRQARFASGPRPHTNHAPLTKLPQASVAQFPHL